MINLRQDRWLGPGFPGFGLVRFAAAAVVCAGVWLPCAAAAALHTHARKPLPTALHSSRVTDAGTHPVGKHGKTSAKPRAGARSTGATSGETGSRKGKRGKGRPQPAEPDDSPIPMYRAGRTDRASQRSRSSFAKADRRTGTAPHWGNHPAPLVSRDRHAGRGAVEVAESRPARFFEAAPAHPATQPSQHYIPHHHPAQAHSDPASQWSSSRADASSPSPAASARATPPSQPRHPEVYAQGTAHPDDDERLPRDRTVMGEDAPASPAPVARLSAAPSSPVSSPASALPLSPVVQGFGSELAVPSAGADRPGGTRRRSHPSNWQPESLNQLPEPLEEREAITYAAVSPAVLPEIYDHDGRLMMPAPLRGSHDVLVHQNVMANNDGLERIYDDADLERLRASHQLVTFPVSESLRVNEDLPLNRRVARPWTVMFATDISHAFYQRFRQPLQVNSAVRTVRYQARLQMVNGNAAAISGDAASPHLTGQAIDFGKRGLSPAEMAWMRGFLLPLMQSGKIDVEEEFQQACFHISVYRSYASGRRPAREFAQVHAAAAEETSTDTAAKPRMIAP